MPALITGKSTKQIALYTLSVCAGFGSMGISFDYIFNEKT